MNSKTPKTEEESRQAFLDLHPKWNRDWEEMEDGQIVVLVPKFGDHPLGRWLMARLAKPYLRLKLDEVGSFVWQRCNGMNSVRDIAADLERRFGEKVHPTEDRLILFLRQLHRAKSIVWT